MKPVLLALTFPAYLMAQQAQTAHASDARRRPASGRAEQPAILAPPNISLPPSHQQPAEYRAAELPNLSGALTGVGADNGSRLAAGALNNPAVYSRTAGGVIASQLITDFGRTQNLVGMSNLQAQAQDQTSEATRADVLLSRDPRLFRCPASPGRAEGGGTNCHRAPIRLRSNHRAGAKPVAYPARRQLRQRESGRCEAPAVAGREWREFRPGRARDRSRIAQSDHVRCCR